MRHSLSPLALAHTVMISDMSRLFAGEGRLDVRIGATQPERDDAPGYLEERFPEFVEVLADA